jgi:predicted nucleic acid-binding protein
MIVVDTNLIVYFWIQGEHTALAERIMRKDAHWVAPPLWRSGFRAFVALADSLQTWLVTADRKILKSFPRTALSVESFAAKH